MDPTLNSNLNPTLNPPLAAPAGPAVDAYIGLGANLGDAAATVRAAAQALGSLPGTQQVAVSGLFASAPVEAQGPDFINAVVHLRTRLQPLALLAALQALELVAGRQRPYRNAPRTLDLDLLLHGQTVCQGAVLTLPHPRLHLRRFVLWPLAELAPNLVLPGLGPVQDWLPRVADQDVRRC